MPTSVPNGSNSTPHRCKLRISRLKHKHMHKHSCPLSFDERRGCWAHNHRPCSLASLQYHRQSFRQRLCCQANHCQHHHSSTPAKDHRRARRMLGHPRPSLDLSISRSCRSSLPTRCTFSNRHQHNRACNNCNLPRLRKSNLRHPSTSTTGYLQRHNRRRTQAEIRLRRPQVNTNLRPPLHTNPVNVRRLMRLTASTSAPPRSGRPKALTQRHRPQHRHPNPIHHRPSRMYRRHRHQRPDDEDTHEPVQMHLREVQRVL